METQYKKWIMLATIIIATGIFNSCKKENEQLLNLNDAITVSQDDAEVSALFDEVFSEVDEVTKTQDAESLIKNTTEKPGIASCRKININQTDTFPMVITIDYGETNCTNLRNKSRRGKIIVTVTGKYMETGSKRIITFDNFYVNDYKIEGVKTVTTNERNTDNNLTFTVTLENGKATSPDSLVFTKEFERTREWIEGESTILNYLDDEYLISGSSTGATWSGINYTSTITTPLHVDLSCRWIKAGVIKIELEDRPSLEINYGDGECDAKAILTYDGEPREILMK